MLFHERRLVAPPRVDAQAEGWRIHALFFLDSRQTMVTRYLSIGFLAARFSSALSLPAKQYGRASWDEGFVAQVRDVIQHHVGDPLYTTTAAARRSGDEQNASESPVACPDGKVHTRIHPCYPAGGRSGIAVTQH